ncbi:MAG TPA: DUF302 domain-containing protein [Chloroflexota bacterium]|nr:DUF302 domain-containing protein [Chloroflexota bacterium]
MKLEEYGMTTAVSTSYQETVEYVRALLKEEGFGVLTEIDVKQTMKEKLGLDVDNYIILGACNPPLAHRALSSDPYVGLLLPCNVIVFEKEGRTVVSAIDPISMMAGLGNEPLEAVAREVRPRLERVIQKLGQDVPSRP